MATIGAELAAAAAGLVAIGSPPEPPDPFFELTHPPNPSQAGAITAWEAVRSFFTTSAPWQHALYQSVGQNLGVTIT